MLTTARPKRSIDEKKSPLHTRIICLDLAVSEECLLSCFDFVSEKFSVGWSSELPLKIEILLHGRRLVSVVGVFCQSNSRKIWLSRGLWL